MRHVILMFGEMGSGKSHLGKSCTPAGAEFMEGDDWVPDAMKEAVRKFGRVTELMRAHLVKRLKWAVRDKLMYSSTGCVAVSQALYNDNDRRELLDFWHNQCGFTVQAYYVKTGSRWQNMKQLLQRPNGWRWVAYWLASKPFFQEPTHSHIVLRNNGAK